MKQYFAALCLICFGIMVFSSGHNAQTVEKHDIFIRLNQVGYLADSHKSAIAFGTGLLPASFSIIDDNSSETVFTGKASSVDGRWGNYEQFVLLDFTAVNKTGRYMVQYGENHSIAFEISSSIYTELPDQLLEFMRQQRCGYNPWHDVVCHPYDGRSAFGPLPEGTFVDASGGWHDAADMLKYLITGSNATAQMLAAWIIQRDVLNRTGIFTDQYNAFGQTGANNIPDILDEAKWGLDWMLKLHPAPDILFHQVADDRDHAGWRLPQDEHVDYGWGEGLYRVVYCADGKPQGLQEYKSESDGMANIAGRYAAAMALGYQVWKDDSELSSYADQLLQAGRQVYLLGKQYPGVQQGNSYKAPYRYEESTWADDMQWGAAELYRATGEKQYLEDAKLFAEMAGTESWMGKERARHYYYYPFINMGHYRLYDLVEPEFQEKLAQWYREGIEASRRMAQERPFEIGVPFIWCSNNLVVALATQCFLYEMMTGDSIYSDFAMLQVDWLLGRNPWGYSMFTEIPAHGVFPQDVHLMTNVLQGKSVRGGLVDGPVYQDIFESLLGIEISEPDPLASFQDTLAVFHDDQGDYSTNEPTMDGTASAILLWSIMNVPSP